jgi:hypothetical protein
MSLEIVSGTCDQQDIADVRYFDERTNRPAILRPSDLTGEI